MIDIDYIMDLIDWNKSQKDQLKGIKMAKKILNINVFLQPCNKGYDKNVWDNCAKILSNRNDEELRPYLIDLFRWLQDLNWPGALYIFDRLKNYSDTKSFDYAYDHCMQIAKSLGDETWIDNLEKIKNSREHTKL